MKVRDNHIYFLNKVSKSSIYRLGQEIHNITKKYNKLQRENSFVTITPKPIFLHLNTDGGCSFSAWVGADMIKNSKIPINTIIEGRCMSAGTILSVAGVERYMEKNAYMMIHQLSGGIDGTYQQMKDEMNFYKKDMKKTIDYYHQHSSMSKMDIEKQLQRDEMWDFDTALNYGFIDKSTTLLDTSINDTNHNIDINKKKTARKFNISVT